MVAAGLTAGGGGDGGSGDGSQQVQQASEYFVVALSLHVLLQYFGQP